MRRKKSLIESVFSEEHTGTEFLTVRSMVREWRSCWPSHILTKMPGAMPSAHPWRDLATAKLLACKGKHGKISN